MEENMTTNGKTRPVQEFKIGRVRGAVWDNSTENGARFNLTLSRLYKNADGKWRDSSSFGREDLPLVMKVCDLAMTWMYQTPVTDSQEAEATEAANI